MKALALLAILRVLTFDQIVDRAEASHAVPAPAIDAASQLEQPWRKMPVVRAE